MKELTLLVWLTQFGLSVAAPPAGFILLAVWLQNRFQLGNWIIWVGVILGVICAIDGLRSSLRMLEKLTRDKKKKDKPDALSFNDHD